MAVWGALIGAAINYAAQQGQSQDIPSMADPWAGNRAQYMGRLNELMSGNFQADPSYNWRLHQGTENLNRGMAQSGQLGSGLQQVQLQQLGQNMASQEYQNQFNRLSQLAGVNVGSPVSAADLAYKQRVAQGQGAGILGTAAFDALKAYYSQPSTTGTTTDTTYSDMFSTPTTSMTGYQPLTSPDALLGYQQ